MICFPSVFVTCRGCMFSLALSLHLLLCFIVNLLFCFNFVVIVVVFLFTSIILCSFLFLFLPFYFLAFPLLPELFIYNLPPLLPPLVTITLQDVALPSTVPSLTDATTDHVASSPERSGPTPSAPRDVVASLVSTRFIKLTWRLPAEPHGENITYSVFYSLDGTNRLKMLKDIHVSSCHLYRRTK